MQLISIAGGGDKGKPKENKDDHIDEEKIYEDDQNDGFDKWVVFIAIEFYNPNDNEDNNQNNQNQEKGTQDGEDDDEIDPLDAFMNGIDEEVRKEETNKVIRILYQFIVENKTCWSNGNRRVWLW